VNKRPAPCRRGLCCEECQSRHRAKTKEQIMEKNTIFVGLDVHKNTIDVGLADAGRDSEVRFYGSIGGDLDSLHKVIRKIQSTGATLRVVYEAGPCGYDIYRSLTRRGVECMVVAPSKIPRKSGDRIKNDRRDALNLARLHRAGELTPVYVPTVEDEAMRDLTRGREDAVKAHRTGRQVLLAFLLRHGYRYSGVSYWSKAHWNWIGDIKMPHPAQQITLQEYVHAVHEQSARVQRLTQQIQELVAQWDLALLVQGVQGLRGVSLIVAATTVAELGDLTRFASAKQIMAYLGLVPSEHSSGDSVKRGGITKTGNSHVRRALIEAAQAYSHPARESRVLLGRLAGLPEEVRKIAWKAQVRLCDRFRRLTARGKNRNTVITAIARELAAFMWAIANELRPMRKA
jgi:transposase